ncbi:ATP phosphoribosyltransferase [Pseudocolwellia sp. AS88]|jgi:ATP phosphoribosyltransferase|uniref:ATP phosphoribosyltransferase n=1 Tax=Pseudocolwellia TaxID=2848177 RepID=UPI0026EA2FD4|nr:ATP phosphoribosyltransferase [Pseudocolwellia sp. AS88]MDO7085407.1 ATP phosphoribosyltransferase [Pseudocolwellia sp. AS88]
MTTETRLRIAMQKSGRLSDDTQALFKRCGLKINVSDRRLLAHVANMPIDIMRVRSSDIPGLIMDGVCDLGIVGDNTLEEEELSRGLIGSKNDYIRTTALNFGGCRFSIAMPEEFEYTGLKCLDGLRFATTYPQLLKRFAKENGINVEFCLLKGSVEVAPRVGLADGICDLVSTGATLEANGLKEVAEVFRSKASLIQRAETLNPEKQAILDTLLPRIHGVMKAKESKYIMLHAPKDKIAEVSTLMPGTETPTILPLASSEEMVAVHVVATETFFWETMEDLKALGCRSILVMPIEKMMG